MREKHEAPVTKTDTDKSSAVRVRDERDVPVLLRLSSGVVGAGLLALAGAAAWPWGEAMSFSDHVARVVIGGGLGALGAVFARTAIRGRTPRWMTVREPGMLRGWAFTTLLIGGCHGLSYAVEKAGEAVGHPRLMEWLVYGGIGIAIAEWAQRRQKKQEREEQGGPTHGAGRPPDT
jgi:hypothetical protein